MLSDNPFIAYAILSPRYYETLDRYQADAEYRDVVSRLLPDHWAIQCRGFWTHCKPTHWVSLEHGWKIHVSTSLDNVATTLTRVVPHVVSAGVAFKFVSDRRMVMVSLTKNWSQAQAGKFMAIYPRDEQQFVELIRTLSDATADMDGPFILSDRPAPGSRVVFYRYGEHRGQGRASERGRIRRGFLGPSGEWYDDDRKPYFQLPPWIHDPIEPAPTLERPGTAGVTLAKGRYRVLSALKYNADGGIYGGIDTATESPVVIREARPHLGSQKAGQDSFSLLEKESRILKRLEKTGHLPRFVDLFREWKHLFLVQERLNAESLWGYAIGFYFTPDYKPSDTFARLVSTIRKIAVGLQRVHGEGVILRDLTRNNLMVTSDGAIKFIDLEFAYEPIAANP